MSALDTIFREVLDVSWRASLLIVAVFAIRAVLRNRLPARVVFWAWIALAIRSLLPVSFDAAWSPLGIPSLAERVSAAPLQIAPPTRAVAPANDLPSTGPDAAAIRPGADFTWTGPAAWQLCAWVWGAGAVALVLIRFAAWARFVGAVRRSRSPAGEIVQQTMAEVAEEWGKRPIAAWETDAVLAPAVQGIFQPRLLLPRGLADKLTPAALRLILAHEIAHLERRDLLAQALIRAAVVVHWFNPLVWIAARFARDDCELACDERVLRGLTARQREAYGMTLLEIVALAGCGTTPPLALGVVESKQQIKRRIQMIVDQPSSNPIRTFLGCATFLVLAAVSLSRETLAQPASPTQVAPAAQSAQAPKEASADAEPAASAMTYQYDASIDGLDSLYPDGIIATVGDRVITVAEVRREVQPLVPDVMRESGSQDDFNRRLRILQNDVVGHLLNRVLVVKQFREHSETIPEKHVPAKIVDDAIADITKERFDNDPAKLAASLQARGITMDAYWREVEEDIIFGYMKMQERKLLKSSGAKAAGGNTGS